MRISDWSSDVCSSDLYALKVVDIVYRNCVALDLPIITAALVQGDALGGGFEGVLSSNLIVAEKGCRFGLPEILFNLFPGMGAYSLLARRISPALAERMIRSEERRVGKEGVRTCRTG